MDKDLLRRQIVDEIQAEFDTKLRQAKRQKEQAEGELEAAVAEAIARASNPLRSTQPMKEQFEIELNRVAQEKTEIEQAFLRAKTQWEQEKLKITGEMVKLRRAAQIMGQPLPKEDKPDRSEEHT